MLSVAIQHHPLRAPLAAALAAAIGGQVDVVADPDPGGYRSPWRTYRHALEQTPPGATHRCIVQDDTEVCAGFRTAVEAAVAAKPDRLLAFFVAGVPREHAWAVRAAAERDVSWVELDTHRWCPTIALCWPAELIDPLIAYVDAQGWPVEFRADDEIVGRYCRDHAVVPLASVPSLVEHRDVEPSLIGLRAMGGLDVGRVAACYIDPACDVASIDWTAGP